MVTNAIVEHRGAPVGFITTRGFRDVLEIGRMSRLHLYRLDLPAKAEPLVPRRLRREVTERVARRRHRADAAAPGRARRHRGGLQARGHRERRGVPAPRLRRVRPRAGAPPGPRGALPVRVRVERDQCGVPRVRARAAPPCSMPRSCRSPRATSTTSPAATGGKPLHLLHSAGGMMSVEAAKARPLSMAMSGPAGGVAAAAHTARALGLARALAFDMGGTTTDVCLIADGVPETAGQRKLGDYPARLPMVAVESIGAGGGSIARVEATGALKVGPRERGRRARARLLRPGRPRAHGERRQPAPRLSESGARLRRIHSPRPRAGRGGSSRPSRERFGLTLIEAAHGVVEVANANMLRALRLVSVQRGYDLREFSLIAYRRRGTAARGRPRPRGGDAPAWWCPPTPARSPRSARSCRRFATTPSRRIARRIDAWDAKVVEERFRALEAQCLRPLVDEGHDPSRVARAAGHRLPLRGPELRDQIAFGDGGVPGRSRRPSSSGTASSTATPRERTSSA